MEAGAEHQGAGALSAPAAGWIVGIDLGTTNSALAWTAGRGPVRLFDIPQLVAAGEVAPRPTLPSFLYAADPAQRQAGLVRLPWDPEPAYVAGVFAREEGALVPSRQIASAKSWLSNPRVDRTAPLLPWGTESGPKLSPVEASARLLAHLRDAWNHEHARGDESRRLERQPVVLTVPASFDEEARELTVAAARDAGFADLTLLEEPLAALYAWIAAHRRGLAETFSRGALILVCDVGGGTTDFSLIRATVDAGELAFERIAIGEHLLLGGDNLDLTLAALVERKLSEAPRLSLTQRQVLRRRCTAAKEELLSTPARDRVAITIPGAGRGVIAGAMTADLTREEVVTALTSGFLPAVIPGDLPARDRRAGLRELGLPFETEPAITRHLAAFLTRAGREATGAGMVQPDAVLFNGGFFTPDLARQQIVDVLAAWSGAVPRVLHNERPEAAVAIGAAFYGRLRRDPEAGRRLLIRAGSARAYYVGVEGESGDGRRAVCVLPRGTEEGTRLNLEREFTVIANQPAAFTLYSSTARTDAPDTVVTLDGSYEAQRHAPLVTAFRYGKRSRRVPLAIHLTSVYTETGTLELWCESRSTGHRWRLAFNLRAFDADPLEESADGAAAADTPSVLIPDPAIDEAVALLRNVFGSGAGRLPPDALIGELETTLGHGKSAWPLEAIRRLADVLLELEPGRRKSAAHEVRWLNLTGFCTRPGFGTPLDAWRVSELRKVYAAGLAFPREVQNQVEWLVLWQRIGAGFTAGQQRELALRIGGQLGLGGRKGSRLNPQIERESWRLLAALERLDAGYRARLGDELLERARREPRNPAWMWAMGRLGARTPLYGPLNSVVAPGVAERWIARLLAAREVTEDGALAIARIGARTDDPARDIADDAADQASAKLLEAGFDGAAVRLRDVVPPDRIETGRVFGETLPEGLRLA